MRDPITLSIPDAVRASGLSRSSIYIALRNGEIEARKAGRRTLIPFAALQKYLDGLPKFDGEIAE